MKRTISVARVVWDSDWLWRLLLAVGVTVAMGWIGFIVSVAFTLFYIVWDARAVHDDVPCAKCVHRKDEHHGNCQACLRDELHGTLTIDEPCSRFARQSAERSSTASQVG